MKKLWNSINEIINLKEHHTTQIDVKTLLNKGKTIANAKKIQYFNTTGEKLTNNLHNRNTHSLFMKYKY